MSTTTSSTSSTPASDLTLDGARRYLRRRRLLLTLPFAILAAVAVSRGAKTWERAALLERCERQRHTTELIVDVARTIPGVVQVKGLTTGDPLPPAVGDVAVGRHGAWLVGEGRVLALDTSCEAGVR